MSQMRSIDMDGVHLCVFTHGLWGNPAHLNHLTTSLKNAFPDEKLHILLAKSNVGNYTYDGIELGAERVMQEIEEEFTLLKQDEKMVEKISIVGYSLGGLISRYLVGLLYSKGILENIEPVNFTTFATPHLGVRTPIVGWRNDIYNSLGSKTLSVSGRQLWAIDNFRDTERPLLSILADPDSVFMRGLKRFRRRSLYSNIVNDRAVPFYTSFISPIDPFGNLDAIDIHYTPGYDDVILEDTLATPKGRVLTFYESVSLSSQAFISKAPFYLMFTALMPIAGMAFFVNSAIQSYQSAQRIRSYETGKAGESYRLPIMIESVQRQADAAIERVNSIQKDEHLPEDEDGIAYPGDEKQHDHHPDFPTLALTEEQFTMIENLKEVEFEKFAVHIKQATHSHAAIILRTPREAFGEGKVVSKHWTERFMV